ncbi:MAG: M28 family metallopeptidase [Acidobacteriota bacterium]
MKRRALLAAALVAVAGAAAAPSRTALRGFSPTRAAQELDLERRLTELPQPSECGALLREITSTPHLAGTDGGRRVADLVAREFAAAGLEVETPRYDVLLSYPKRAELEIVGEPSVRLARAEEPIAGDPDTSSPAAAGIPWNAYAPSAALEAEVVYVNRGSAADYDALAKKGVDVRGRVALARYFGGYRGGKSLEGEKRGVAAILVYSDPVDDGWFQGEVYPAGPWGPLSHVQRGANVYDFLVPGDPLTPGWASTAGARRIAESDSEILPKVPMMPLSARDAAEILRRLGGASALPGWQGVATGDTYRVGPGPVRVRLAIENTRERREIRNVIGTLRGTDEPGRTILLSNHHDAWVYGAVDPSSGTATMISLARAMGALAREGRRPRRTIVFASWDAEEYTLTGSTEWGEEHEKELKENALLCINVDAAASGDGFSASASPTLFSAIREAAASVADPAAAGRTIADSWKENATRRNIRSYATGDAPGEDLPVAILGSGSDYTVFFNRLGIASMDLTFDGPYGVYHSLYDDYGWMSRVGDPGFRYHAAMARLVGVLAMRFANADVLPFQPSRYGREIARYASELARSSAGGPLRAELGDLARAADHWSRESETTERAVAVRLARSAPAAHAGFRRENDWLASLERAVSDDAGLPRRPWFRHLVYAPLPSYAAETLPAVREAAESGDAAAAREQIRRLTGKLTAAAGKAAAIR